MTKWKPYKKKAKPKTKPYLGVKERIPCFNVKCNIIKIEK
jgi:hypothetical protein